MLRHVRHHEIDRLQWDALISQSANGLIYALAWYLDIVSPGWEALLKEEQGRYVAVLPLPVQRKFGLRYLKQPLFGQQLGLFYVVPPTAADWAAVSRLLNKQVSYITRYAFNVANAELASPATLGMPGGLARTYHLSLRAPYPALWAGYRPERRRHLRKAQAHGLVVEPSTDINLLIRLFDENTAHRITGMLGEGYQYPLLRTLYGAASRAGLGTMWQARTPQGEVVSLMFLLRFKKNIIYLFNCSTAAGKAMGAVSVMLDEFFRQHAGQDLCFDFESPGVPSLERFYGSFGSVAAPYFYVSADHLPWPVRQLKAARMALYRRLRPQRPAPNSQA
jgi:hypothetical protein